MSGGGVDWQSVVSILGPSMLEDTPVIPNIQVGSTCYLDRVPLASLVNGAGLPVPVVKGIDRHARPFVTFTVYWSSPDTDVQLTIYTIFQRYTDHGLWVMCESHDSPDRGSPFATAIGACTAIDSHAKTNLIEFFASAQRGESWWRSDTSTQFSLRREFMNYGRDMR